MAQAYSMALIALVSICFLFKLGSAEEMLYGGLWSSAPWWASVEQALRSPAADDFPAVAHTYSFTYSINARGALFSLEWRNRGERNWTSQVVPGLNVSLPWLSTEEQLGGPALSESVFFLNLADGHIYSFTAVGNQTAPVWRSSFYCSQREGQQLQRMSVNSDSGFVIAQCEEDLAVMNMTTGELFIRIRNRDVNLLTGAQYVSPGTVAIFRGRKIIALSLSSRKIVPWTVTIPEEGFLISSLTAHPSTRGVVGVTGVNSSTMYFVSSMGDILSSITLVIPQPELSQVTVLPTPKILSGVLYGHATMMKVDPFEELPPQSFFTLFAVNLTDFYDPTIQWQREPMQGAIRPAPVLMSKKFVYVTVFSTRQFQAYARENGTYAWFNIPFMAGLPRSWSPMYQTGAPYCCDLTFFGGKAANGNGSNYLVPRLSVANEALDLVQHCNCDT